MVMSLLEIVEVMLRVRRVGLHYKGCCSGGDDDDDDDGDDDGDDNDGDDDGDDGNKVPHPRLSSCIFQVLTAW